MRLPGNIVAVQQAANLRGEFPDARNVEARSVKLNRYAVSYARGVGLLAQIRKYWILAESLRVRRNNHRMMQRAPQIEIAVPRAPAALPTSCANVELKNSEPAPVTVHNEPTSSKFAECAMAVYFGVPFRSRIARTSAGASSTQACFFLAQALSSSCAAAPAQHAIRIRRCPNNAQPPKQHRTRPLNALMAFEFRLNLRTACPSAAKMLSSDLMHWDFAFILIFWPRPCPWRAAAGFGS